MIMKKNLTKLKEIKRDTKYLELELVLLNYDGKY